LAAYVIFDVEIRDMAQYQEFMKGVEPAVEAAGGKYLARGGAHKVYEGDWEPTNRALRVSIRGRVRVLLQRRRVQEPPANPRRLQFRPPRQRRGPGIGAPRWMAGRPGGDDRVVPAP